MNRFFWATLILLLLLPHPAQAQCVDDSRTAAGGHLKVKAYICRTANAHIRVEFHRLTSGAASLLMSGYQNAALREVVGAPILQRNEVSAGLQDIVTRFGSTYDPKYSVGIQAFAAAPGGGAVDHFEDSKSQPISVLSTDWTDTDGFYYPAARELRILLDDKTPTDMQRKRDYLWRFMRMQDLQDYQSNLTSFNSMMIASRNDATIPDGRDSLVDLMAFVGQQGLPDDFAVMTGWYSEGGCGSGTGWIFQYYPRVVIMDAVKIENLSSAPLQVSALTGARSAGGLRPYAREPGSQQLPGLQGALQPGQSALVPMRLVFAPSDDLREFTTTSYMFGPAYSVAGLVANGDSIIFENRSANFLRLSLVAESGSCPFLMSWNEAAQDWHDHGKILHRASAADLEYEETVVFGGYRNRFRLEEREPEIAYIDRATLDIALHDGRTLTLQPDRDDLRAVDQDRATFLWGERIAFNFTLPERIAADDVKTSTLRVTGHYVQYVSMTSAGIPQGIRPATAKPQHASMAPDEVCLLEARQAPRPASHVPSFRKAAPEGLSISTLQ